MNDPSAGPLGPTCTCDDVNRLLLDTIEERDPGPPCELHQPDEHSAGMRDAERRAAEAERDRLRDAVDEVRAADRLRAEKAEQEKADEAERRARRHLHSVDPLLGQVVEAVGAKATELDEHGNRPPPVSNDVAIGDDDGIVQMLTDQLDPYPPAA